MYQNRCVNKTLDIILKSNGSGSKEEPVLAAGTEKAFRWVSLFERASEAQEGWELGSAFQMWVGSKSAGVEKHKNRGQGGRSRGTKPVARNYIMVASILGLLGTLFKYQFRKWKLVEVIATPGIPKNGHKWIFPSPSLSPSSFLPLFLPLISFACSAALLQELPAKIFFLTTESSRTKQPMTENSETVSQTSLPSF